MGASTARLGLGWSRHAPALVTGGVIGSIEVLLAVSLGGLVFSAALPDHVGVGIGLGLFGAIVVMAVAAVRSRLPGAIASIQDVTAAVLVVVAAGVTRDLGAGDPRTLPTVVVAIALTTLLTGVFLWGLGLARLGRLVRFVPYPVIGGFLAGTGWLLFAGGVGLATGVDAWLTTPEAWTADGFPALFAAGMAVGVVLLVGIRRGAPAGFIPAVCLGVLVAFHAVVALGPGHEAARAGGWLLGPFPEGGLWPPDVALLLDADLAAVAGQWVAIATVAALSAVALLLNASGIELAGDADADMDRELRVAGGANVLAAIGGGLPGFHALSLSALAQRAQVSARVTGLTAAAILGIVLLFGAELVALMPRALVGGLLVFLGLAFLTEWLVDGRRTLRRLDHLVVVLIVVVIATVGFLEGVAIGSAVAAVLFLVTSSRAEVVRQVFTGHAYRSHVDRPPADRRWLEEHGDDLVVVRLQGALFFGSASRLVDQIRPNLVGGADQPPRYVVIDLHHVTDLDSSAALALDRLRQLVARGEGHLVLAEPSPAASGVLDGGSHALAATPRFADLDLAVQWCEDRLLERPGHAPDPPGALATLTAALGDRTLAQRLLARMQELSLPAGTEVLRQGSPERDLYVVRSGTVSATLTDHHGHVRRLRTMRPGTIVGEVGLYLAGPRSASVVADEDVTLARLPADAFDALERDDPELAAALHRALARGLAERLASTLGTIEALSD